MDLILDIGNTRTKYAIGNSYGELPETSTETIQALFESFSGLQRCIISSVKSLDSKILSSIRNYIPEVLFFDENTLLPIKNNYKTPDTLGKDRLAAVVGANNIFPGSNVLVVDSGTAITFDFIDEQGIYHGGTISPGLNTRFRSLNEHTDKLPLLTPSEDFGLLGSSTNEAILYGVQNGLLFEIDSYIDAFKEKYTNLKVIITGGDRIFFVKKLKNTIFAEPNLVLKGLQTILNYNAKI